MHQVAREACHAAAPGGTLRALVPARSGNVKRTYLATVDPGGHRERLVVQFHPDADRLRVEAALLDAVAERTDVPVPEVRAVGRAGGIAFLVTGYVRGVNLHRRFASLPLADQRAVVGAFGRALGSLHETFAFAGFGDLVRDGDDLAVADPTTDWPGHLRALVDEGLDRLATPLGDLRTPIREALATACGGGVVAGRPRPTLYPWDLRPGNALYDGREVAAFLDWDDPQSACAEFSLAKAEYLVVDWYVEEESRVEALRTAFHDAYREVRALDPGYREERRRVYRLGAIVLSATDSNGAVTRPRYPMVSSAEAYEFHRSAVEALL
jgi:Ser/Thr protein kinase RdoA (MazF antagonist)